MPTLLVLGAGSDIAYACVQRFMQSGFDLILAGRDVKSLQNRYTDYNADFLFFDASDTDGHVEFYSQVMGKIDVVLCAFGYLSEGVDHEDVIRVMESNYVGAVSILSLVADDFRRRKSGVILGIGSVAGDRGRRKNHLYGSAKAGLGVYLAGLRAVLYPYGVHVCTIKPGYVRTKMIEGMKTSAFLTKTPKQLADTIYRKGYQGRKNVVYSSGVWRLIMLVIKCLPESVIKRMNF